VAFVRRPHASSIALASLALLGCNHKPVELTDGSVPHHKTAVADATIQPPSALDLLFVVDNSASMAAEQNALATSFPVMLDAITKAAGTQPDLHVGVISTNVGAGPYNLQQCTPPGDDGHLLVGPPGAAACAGLDAGARFLSDVAGAGGARVRNYTGSLDTVFGCMAQLGTTGCGLEQPLASLRRALDPSNTSNAGFVRDDARLAIVIVSDEDDCSVKNTAMFDPAPTAAAKGAINFRCTEYGVTCDGDPDLLTFGARSNCRPNEASTYMEGVQAFVTALRTIKKDPGQIFVAGLLGPATPFEIDADADGSSGPDKTAAELQPSCTSSTGSAVPAVRTRALLDAFPGQSASASICDPLTDQFSALGTAIAAPLAHACVGVTLFDNDDAAPGLQASCTVTANPSGTVATLPQCGATAGAAQKPCWTLLEDPAQCAVTSQHLRVDVDWGTMVPKPGTTVHADCEVP